jgi:glycosyltransferase involved in cell wall biosynthesis
MRIALFTDGMWPYVLGGMQKHSYYLCKYLAQKGVEVDVFHYNDSTYDISKLEFFSLEERKNIHSYVIPFPDGRKFLGHYIWKNYVYSKHLFQTAKDKIHLYDFIYTKGFTGWYLINQKKKGKISCARIGVKFHGYEMFQIAPNFKTKLQHILVLRPWVERISQSADIVFSYGAKITDIIRSIGVKQANIIELPSGVEATFVQKQNLPVHSPLRFVYLGRYERRKGIEELNQALTTLAKDKHYNFSFHFIGPIPEDKKIKDARVIYHGELRDKADLVAKLREADVLVCPSWSEGMPNVILEAMANGLAVVATDTGATKLLVNNSTGWLMPFISQADLLTVLKNILTTPTVEVEQKKSAALQLIRTQFVWEQLVNDLLQKLNLLK